MRFKTLNERIRYSRENKRHGIYFTEKELEYLYDALCTVDYSYADDEGVNVLDDLRLTSMNYLHALDQIRDHE